MSMWLPGRLTMTFWMSLGGSWVAKTDWTSPVLSPSRRFHGWNLHLYTAQAWVPTGNMPSLSPRKTALNCKVWPKTVSPPSLGLYPYPSHTLWRMFLFAASLQNAIIDPKIVPGTLPWWRKYSPFVQKRRGFIVEFSSPVHKKFFRVFISHSRTFGPP